MFAASSTFTLSIGDFVLIIGAVVGASIFVAVRLAGIPAKIHKGIRQHENRCSHFMPQRGGAAELDTLTEDP